jgi:TolB-like protein
METEAKGIIAEDKPPAQSKDKPSIAVLPFVNMSGDQEQEYFSDGVTEDIITALAKILWFLVIARNSVQPIPVCQKFSLMKCTSILLIHLWAKAKRQCERREGASN